MWVNSVLAQSQALCLHIRGGQRLSGTIIAPASGPLVVSINEKRGLDLGGHIHRTRTTIDMPMFMINLAGQNLLSPDTASESFLTPCSKQPPLSNCRYLNGNTGYFREKMARDSSSPFIISFLFSCSLVSLLSVDNQTCVYTGLSDCCRGALGPGTRKPEFRRPL